jgi:hypothetical protein
MRRFWFARAGRSKHQNNIRKYRNLGITKVNIVSANMPVGCADNVARDLSPDFRMVFCAILGILAQWFRSPTRKYVFAKPRPSGSAQDR